MTEGVGISSPTINIYIFYVIHMHAHFQKVSLIPNHTEIRTFIQFPSRILIFGLNEIFYSIY